MYPTVNDLSDWLRRRGFQALRQLIAASLCCFLVLGSACTAFALSDTQQLVVDSWRLVNQGFWNPEQLDAVRWKRQRQKAMERSIESSNDAYAAIESMLAQLGDPYTRLLRPEDYTALKNSTNGSLSGVGLQLGPDESSNGVVVISALEGSPAGEAEITSGTQLLSVDGRAVVDLGLEGTVAALRGDVGSQVVLTLDNGSGETSELTLERRSVDLRPVRTRRLRSDSHTLGYLRITQFSEGVPEQVKEALTELQNKEIEGLVLDLRNNSGGLVSAGLAVADDFLSGGAIVETRNREGINDTIQASLQTVYDGPMVTLVNGGTASASEILAGALQDNERATLLGRQTFGKGLIQTLTNLSDGSGLAVTVAGYVTPSGRDIQGEGIAPDRGLSDPEPLNPGGDGDRWLSEAEQWMEALLEQPAEETEA
ncbi:carboxyl-terminal processing protease CtpZ [Synechococcus sp. RS9902]|uniref:carboxyl-terminal processing protease CtpZ n=1 Tax=Synechococcus sp. RS9902 TaxID=221345 RepID=UPI0016482FD7|nr:carboxyl-terminal processing protease CtpZ [Synechococcus sp. RS9902]QNI96417.1 carboxy-terminal processing peptidase [Synechococcus sp. RS9902]